MIKNNYFILSGAPGSGKSTLIEALRAKGYTCVDEPAREIIAQQKAINGEGLYEKNTKLFLDLISAQSISNYQQYLNSDQPIIFDRAIPDVIAYAKLGMCEYYAYLDAAKIYQYNTNVFYLPVWDKIYINDEDRKMLLADAKQFDELIRKSYIESGYRLLELPATDVNRRAEFIINKM